MHRRLSPDLELGKSPGFLHFFHLWIGLGLDLGFPARWVSGRPVVGKLGNSMV
jgi:hypothetical protein